MKHSLKFVVGLVLILVPVVASATPPVQPGEVFFSNSTPNLLGANGHKVYDWQAQKDGIVVIKAGHEQHAQEGYTGWKLGQVMWEDSLTFAGRIDPKTNALTLDVAGIAKTYNPDGSVASNYRIIKGTLVGSLQSTLSNNRLVWAGTARYERETGIKVITEETTFKLTAPGNIKVGTPVSSAKDNSQTVRIISFEGDVEYSRDGGKTFSVLTKDIVLQKGDIIMTGFDSRAQVDFGYGQLWVGQTTQLRFDEFTNAENLQKTQLYLRVGTVQAKLKRPASIRGDFSVHSPTAISSIRGSEMVVVYDDKLNKTTTYVTEDKAYVKGVNDTREMEVLVGNQTEVGNDGKSTISTTSDTAAVPQLKAPAKTHEALIWLLMGLGVIILVALLTATFRRYRSK